MAGQDKGMISRDSVVHLFLLSVNPAFSIRLDWSKKDDLTIK